MAREGSASMQADNLIEFVTVARSGSLALAAERLSLSQSSLSRHMRDLERKLSLTLLKRLPNGVELTPEGRHVYMRAVDMAEIVSDIANYASHLATPPETRTMRIAGTTVLPLYARVFSEAADLPEAPGRPSFKVAFPSSGDTKPCSACDLLERGEADICLARPVELTPELNEHFRIEKFSEERIVALASPTHALAGRPSITIDDLEGHLLLHADSYLDYANYAWLELRALLRKHGVRYLAETCELRGSNDWLDSSTSRGIVILTASHHMVPTLQAYGRLAIPVVGEHYTFFALCRPNDADACALVRRASRRLAELRA